MNSQRFATTAIVLVLMGGATALGWRYFAMDDRPEKVRQLQEEVVAQAFSEDVSKWTRDRTTESLMREVDQLNEEQRRDAREAIGEQYRQWHLEAARQWNTLPEHERGEFLESQLTKARKWQSVFYAMRSDAPRVPDRFRKSYIESQKAAALEAESNGASDSQESDAKKPAASGQRSSRSKEDGRGRRRRGSRDREEQVDPNDPDAVLLANYKKAMGQLMRAKWRERRQRSQGQNSRGPGA